jgi:hypothetical protein
MLVYTAVETNEMWNEFEDIPYDDKARHARKLWQKDGLEGELQWITVPDPFETDFPFHARHPRKRAAPEPDALIDGTGIELKIGPIPTGWRKGDVNLDGLGLEIC